MKKEFIKEIKKGAAIGALISATILAGSFATKDLPEEPKEEQKTTYQTVMTVDSVFTNPDFMFLYDSNGEEFIFEDTEGFTAGDRVAVKMDGCGTEKPFDDYILSVEKIG